jgi:hypothetical protein
MNGRGDRIRTYDPLLPKQMLYQAELRPDRDAHTTSGAISRNAPRRFAPKNL